MTQGETVPGSEPGFVVRPIERPVIGDVVVLATRPCCGPDGVGPCRAVEEGLSCGTAWHTARGAPPVEAVERGEALRERRRSIGLSLGDAARWLGVRVSEVSMLEHGTATVDDWPALVSRLTEARAADARKET